MRRGYFRRLTPIYEDRDQSRSKENKINKNNQSDTSDDAVDLDIDWSKAFQSHVALDPSRAHLFSNKSVLLAVRNKSHQTI